MQPEAHHMTIILIIIVDEHFESIRILVLGDPTEDSGEKLKKLLEDIDEFVIYAKDLGKLHQDYSIEGSIFRNATSQEDLLQHQSSSIR